MTSEGVDFFNNQYYGQTRRLLSFVALWPFEKKSKRLPYIIFVTIVLVMGINLHIFQLLTLERKVKGINEILQTTLHILFVALTYWNLLYNSVLIKEIFKRVRNDWNELTYEDDSNLMKTYVAQSKLYSKAIICAYFLYTAFVAFPSIISFFLYIIGVIDTTKLILPIHNEAFLATRLIFFVMFSFELIMLLAAYIVVVTYFSMFIYLLQHACALFVIVTNEIDRPFMKNEYKFGWVQSITRRKAELEWIVTVIQNYDNAIKFVELIRLLYEQIFAIQVVLASCFIITDIICVRQLLKHMMSAGEVLRVYFYISSTLSVTYLYVHLGERLIEHSTSVYAKCRLIPFYTLSVQTNKLFLLFIMRTMKPSNISVYGIIVASYEHLVMVLKVSFSFATVCYNMH